MNSKYIALTAALLFSAIAPSAFSVTIGFENSTPVGVDTFNQSTYAESGYTFNLGLLNGFISPSSPDASLYGPASNSEFLSICGCSGTVASIQRTDGQLFSLDSIDIGNGSLGNAPISIVGTRGDLTTFTYNYSFTDSQWHTLSFLQSSDFSSLMSVAISGVSGGGISSIALDNINVSQVPVPATAWLFGSGLMGFASLTRKRKTA